MKLTDAEYGKMAEEASAPSKSWRNIPKAFLIGGLICLVGQGLLDFFGAVGFERDEADRRRTLPEGREARRRRDARPDNRLRQRGRLPRNRIPHRRLGARRRDKGLRDCRTRNSLRHRREHTLRPHLLVLRDDILEDRD